MYHITIDTTVCKGCRLCIAVCPAEALGAGTERNTMGYIVPSTNDAACKGCETCAITCPDMAITITKTASA